MSSSVLQATLLGNSADMALWNKLLCMQNSQTNADSSQMCSKTSGLAVRNTYHLQFVVNKSWGCLSF